MTSICLHDFTCSHLFLITYHATNLMTEPKLSCDCTLLWWSLPVLSVSTLRHCRRRDLISFPIPYVRKRVRADDVEGQTSHPQPTLEDCYLSCHTLNASSCSSVQFRNKLTSVSSSASRPVAAFGLFTLHRLHLHRDPDQMIHVQLMWWLVTFSFQ